MYYIKGLQDQSQGEKLYRDLYTGWQRLTGEVQRQDVVCRRWRLLGEETFKSLGRHLLYLSEPLVVLSLFDGNVPVEEKRAIVKRL